MRAEFEQKVQHLSAADEWFDYCITQSDPQTAVKLDFGEAVF